MHGAARDLCVVQQPVLQYVHSRLTVWQYPAGSTFDRLLAHIPFMTNDLSQVAAPIRLDELTSWNDKCAMAITTQEQSDVMITEIEPMRTVICCTKYPEDAIIA